MTVSEKKPKKEKKAEEEEEKPEKKKKVPPRPPGQKRVQQCSAMRKTISIEVQGYLAPKKCPTP